MADREHQLGEVAMARNNASMSAVEGDGYFETRTPDSREAGEPARATDRDALIPPSVETLQSVNSKEKGGESSGSVVRIVLRGWWLELLCLCVVVLALVAIALTLSTQQGRPLPHWPYKISVNSLLSAYVVILKGAMLLIINEGIGSASTT
jgi:hypothetical protein